MTEFAVQTQPRRLGDLQIAEWHPGYCRVSATVKNAGGTTYTVNDPLGLPVQSDGSGGYELVYAGSESSTIGLILWEAPVTFTTAVYTPYPLPILVRGPIVIDYSFGLPVNDPAGSAYTIATIITALKALSPPFVPLAEPTLQTTQTS